MINNVCPLIYIQVCAKGEFVVAVKYETKWVKNFWAETYFMCVRDFK